MARDAVKCGHQATVANVAVGYDILGFAINGPGDEVLLKRGKEKGLKIIEITGAQGKLPLDPAKKHGGICSTTIA